jgi:hypothetical protein
VYVSHPSSPIYFYWRFSNGNRLNSSRTRQPRRLSTHPLASGRVYKTLLRRPSTASPYMPVVEPPMGNQETMSCLLRLIRRQPKISRRSHAEQETSSRIISVQSEVKMTAYLEKNGRHPRPWRSE